MSDVTVTLGAKDEGLSKSLKSVSSNLDDLKNKGAGASKGFDLSFGKIGLAAGVAGAAVKAGMMAVEGATAAARAVVDGFGQAINLGGKLNDLSSSTGETAGNLLLLQRAFDNSGAGAEKVGPAIAKMQKSIQDASEGSKEAVDSLAMMGLTAGDLAGKLPNEQMQILAKGIQGIDDPTQRAAAAMGVFGRSGAELLPLLTSMDGELARASDQLGSLPGVMDRSNVAFDQLSDNMGVISNKVTEFAAGFIEDALPALNTFTSALAGVDAASWGQKFMDQVMSVADFLIGAFKAPMPAIEAIGAALEAGAKIAGNAVLNGFINAGKFLGQYLTSDLPFTAIKTLGSAFGYIYSSFAKGLIDAIISSAKGLEEFFTKAVDSVVRFFTSGFSNFVNGFAQDFKNAMSDPIGFITGKFESGLDAITQGGAGNFKSAFDDASGSVLEKMSAGLGATAAGYQEQLQDGVSKLKSGFTDLIDSIEPSAKDFFGAEDAAQRATDKFGEVAAVGAKLREDFTKSGESAEATKTNTAGAAAEARDVANSFSKAEGSTAKIKEELSASAKLLQSISSAEQSQATDRGGRLQGRAASQIASGNFSGARRTAERIRQNEVENQIRGVGGDRDRRSLADIGRGMGLTMNAGETLTEYRQRIAAARGGSVDKPGRDGNATADSGKDKSSTKSTLEGLVEKIHKLVEKIEPKLPVAALTA